MRASSRVRVRNQGEALMESGLWALNLLAVVYLCFWALRQDSPPSKTSVRKKR